MNKICMVIPGLNQGGMERVMSELANFAVKEGHTVSIICLFKSDVKYKLEESVKVYFPNFEYTQSALNKKKVFSYLLKQLKVLDPETVLGFGEIFNSLTVVACRISGKRVYISDRSSPLKKKGYINDLLRKLIYPYANGFIVQTDFAKAVFSKRGYNKNIKTIANPLKQISNTNLSTAEKKVIVSVGRITASKNHKELIEIFATINKPDWMLYIVGGGPLIEEVQEFITSRRLNDRVKLTGPSNDVDAWLEKADIFAYTSLSEGFPNALSEAVAFPLSSIAYDCPAGPADIITNDVNGILIPMGESEQYKRKLLELMEDKDKRETLKRNAILNRERFSINKIGAKFIDFITAGIKQ